MVVVAGALALAPSSAAQGSSGLTGDTTARYTVVPDEGRVDVRFEYRVQNGDDEPSPGFLETLPSAATAVQVSAPSGGAPAMVPLGTEDGVTTWLVAFSAPLPGGGAAELVIDWQLPGGLEPPGPVVAPAAAGFEVAAAGVGEELRAADPVVEVPLGFVLTVPDDAEVLDREADPAAPVAYRIPTGDGGEPVAVAAVDPLRFTRVAFEGPPEITVADWAADTLWADQVRERAAAAVPRLDAWFGPRVEPLEIRRGAVHAGHPTVALGDEPPWVESAASAAVAVDHQLAHGWLAGLAVDEPWFVEGLAAAFAGERLLPDGPAAVVAPIADEIGPTGVRAVVEAIRSGLISYPGATAEVQPRPPDWRTILDHLEGVGGSTEAAPRLQAALDDPTASAEIDRRAEARGEYEALAEQAAPWTLPPMVRVPMAEWDFDTVAEHRAEVSEALERRDLLEERAEELELEATTDSRPVFESATGDLSEFEELLDAQEEAIEAFDEAEHLVNGRPGLLARAGLVGHDPDGDLSALRDAWANGEYATVTDDGHSLTDLMETSVGRGALRILVPVIVLVGVWQLIRWLTRHRRTSSALVEDL